MDPQGQARRRWRIVAIISAPLLVLYLVFVLLIAFGRSTTAIVIVPGVTLAILLAALVLSGTWVTTWMYVSWANRHLDRRTRQAHTDRLAP